jgi:F-type H+-transporting ATPase subunit alpha
MEEQVVALHAGISGYLDDIPVSDVPRFQEELRESVRAEGSIYEEIGKSGDLSDETTEKLNQQIEKFKGAFSVKEEDSLVA